MPDETVTQAPAAAPVSAPQPATQAEHMIPKSRFDEVNEERRKLQDEIAAIRANEKAEAERQLAEQNKYKELADVRAADLEKARTDLAKSQAELGKISAYEKTLAEVLAAQVAALPEEKRGLVPDELSTAQKLSWLAKNAAILKAPQAPNIGAGVRGGTEATTVNLSPEEMAFAQRFGMNPEEYQKHK